MRTSLLLLHRTDWFVSADKICGRSVLNSGWQLTAIGIDARVFKVPYPDPSTVGMNVTEDEILNL
jgi:hypothetical protein